MGTCRIFEENDQAQSEEKDNINRSHFAFEKFK